MDKNRTSWHHTDAVHHVSSAIVDLQNQRSLIKDPPPIDWNAVASKLLKMYLGADCPPEPKRCIDPFSALVGSVICHATSLMHGSTDWSIPQEEH